MKYLLARRCSQALFTSEDRWTRLGQCAGMSPELVLPPSLVGVVGLREDALVEEEIRYARNGGVAIAYQVVGEGEIDLVYVPDYVSNLVYGWEIPRWRAFYERLARSFRLILFDKRGTGLSDHGSQFAALETPMEDLRAVLDAAGASNAVVLGAQEGCGMAALYAPTYPERTGARWHCSIPSHKALGSRIARCRKSSKKDVRRSTRAKRTGAGWPTGCVWARARRWHMRS